MNIENMPEDYSDEDAQTLTDLCNVVDLEQALSLVYDGDHLVEQAWLTALGEHLERSYHIYAVLAYAKCQGQLPSMGLAIPPGMGADDESI